MSRCSKLRRWLKDVAPVKLPSHDVSSYQNQPDMFRRGLTNLLRETDSDLTVAGTPLSHASWLELLPPHQPARTGL